MAVDVTLGCSCGAVSGVLLAVTPQNSSRLSCMCDDCQLYAQFLGRLDILDASGGTDLSYATQARVRITDGSQLLRAVRLSSTGILRVYTACCSTPVAHVPSPRIAFVGIPHAFTRFQFQSFTRDQAFGPLIHKLQGRFCRGELPPGAHFSTPVHLQLRASLRILWDSVRRQHIPSPFHVGTPLLPVVEPRVLSPLEVARLREYLPTPTAPAAPRFARGCS
jgi:hypothetical protein